MNKEKKIFIFDIDGCILPSIFPKLLERNQTQEEQEKIINKINDRGYEAELFPKFNEFFFKNCHYNDIIYFITGRKKSNFEKLTYHHLSALRYEKIYFYPENGLYTRDYYLNWKYNTIKNLLEKNIKFYIFDDEAGYFHELENLEQYYCKCFKIKSDDDWDTILFIGLEFIAVNNNGW